ncbi:MAG: acylase [Candidatus Solibacter usitatus]|nr:acylase [Candidatus Solibacter usitatus]
MATAQSSRAEILWDTYGVPHIYARDQDSLMRAFGYAQMQSHGDLLLELYGRARGRAAEYWGKPYRDSDVEVRTYGIPKLAQAWYGQQKPEFRSMLDAFAGGMNQYAKEHPERLAVKLQAALPMRGEDVLAHILRVIHFSFVSRGAALEAQKKRWMTQRAETPGSNAWTIAPSRAAGGKAMLLANPHLPWSDFYLWYESQLVAPGMDFYGATLIGNCLPSVGFNQSLGWTHTVNTHDGADVYELTLTPGGDGYAWNGGIKLFDIDRQKLKVRQEGGSTAEEEVVVKASVHGPVAGVKQGKALALRVVGLDQPHMFEQYWRMARARTFDEWEAAVKMQQMPMFTFMYADSAGHIYHLFGGLTPVRPKGGWRYWSGIVPGDTSETLWTKTHPYEELPKVLDPPSGWLQNANDPPWTTTFPAALDAARFPAYMAPRGMAFRPQRSARMAAEDASITFDEMVGYKHSTRMELADRILDELLAAARKHENEDVRRAADILAVWDRCADNNSRGAVLFSEFYQAAARAGSLPKLFTTTWSESDPRGTPRGLNVEVALPLLAGAVRGVKQRYGALDIPWGEVHRLRIDGVDLPANGASGELGVFRVTSYEALPDGKRKAVGGDSFVAAVEFSTPVKAMLLTSCGSASQPGSPHRTDQLPLYSQKRLRPAWLTRAQVEANLESRKSF